MMLLFRWSCMCLCLGEHILYLCSCILGADKKKLLYLLTCDETERTSAPCCYQPWLLQCLHVYAHSFHLLFLEQSATGAHREARGMVVSRSQLGFRDWEAGPDYTWLGLGERRVFFFFSSRPFQGFWWRAGRLWGEAQARPQREASLRVRSVIMGL